MFKLFGGSKPAADPAPPLPAAPEPLVTPESTGLDRLKSAMSVTSRSLIGKIVGLGRPGSEKLTEAELDEIEETLIRADVGVDMAVALTEKIRENPALHHPDALRQFLMDEFQQQLTTLGPNANRLKYLPNCLNIYLVVGVNGAGKTTLIGKLAARFIGEGKSVIIAAADTFRAAAEDQIQIWAERAGAELVRRDNADPGAVIYDAIHQAVETQTDVVIIDTAGRLQNKFNLMEELRKIKKVITREAPPDAMHETLLVLDATTGQNALRQAEVFNEAVQLTGVALTKLDGSSKGGIVFSIARQFKLPVKLVGIGEKIDDLRDFDPQGFIDALFAR